VLQKPFCEPDLLRALAQALALPAVTFVSHA
jgi:hypothetical protein